MKNTFHPFSEASIALATLSNLAIEKKSNISVTINQHGISVRLAGVSVIKNCPPEEAIKRFRAALKELGK